MKDANILTPAQREKEPDAMTPRELWLTLCGLLGLIGVVLLLVGYLGTESGQALMDRIDGVNR